MILDRTIPPSFQPINKIEIPEVISTELSNGFPLHYACYGQQGVFKLELIFNIGYAENNDFHNAIAFSKVLLTGTKDKTGKELNEAFDQYGGYIGSSLGPSALTITLFGLTKYFEKFLNLLKEVIDSATFPEDELELQKKIASQNLQVNEQKPSFLAYRLFNEKLFGAEHPLGWHVTLSAINSITRKSLVSFYEDGLQKAKISFFLSGEAPSNAPSLLEQYFGQYNHKPKTPFMVELPKSQASQSLILQKDSVQSTLRLGKILFSRKEPDFFPLLVANTAFGGYFGSRLMKNIREEKGFTYGISSSIVPKGNSSYLVLGADVVKENTLATLTEVKKELNHLHQELIPSLELETIKNYIVGNFASSLGSSFDVIDKKKTRIIGQLPDDFHHNFVENILAVTASQCQESLEKHYQYDDFLEVIVGERI